MTHGPQADHRTNGLPAVLAQMSGTASRIAVEHLDEVRSACPKLQRSITSHGEVLLGQTFPDPHLQRYRRE